MIKYVCDLCYREVPKDEILQCIKPVVDMALKFTGKSGCDICKRCHNYISEHTEIELHKIVSTLANRA